MKAVKGALTNIKVALCRFKISIIGRVWAKVLGGFMAPQWHLGRARAHNKEEVGDRRRRSDHTRLNSRIGGFGTAKSVLHGLYLVISRAAMGCKATWLDIAAAFDTIERDGLQLQRVLLRGSHLCRKTQIWVQ